MRKSEIIHQYLISFILICLIFSCTRESPVSSQQYSCANCAGGWSSLQPPPVSGETAKTIQLYEEGWTSDSAGLFENNFPGWSSGLTGPEWDYFMDYVTLNLNNATVTLRPGESAILEGRKYTFKGRQLYFTPGTYSTPPSRI